jgi:hypothetical protein
MVGGMRTTVTGAPDELAHQVEAADESLRKSFSGLAVDDVVPEVQQSVTELGIDLDADGVRAWAQAICDRADHRLALGESAPT